MMVLFYEDCWKIKETVEDYLLSDWWKLLFKSKVFTDELLKTFKYNPNKPQFIPKELKNKIQLIVLEKNAKSCFDPPQGYWRRGTR